MDSVAEQPLTLDRLYAAIEHGLRQHLPELQTVATWPEMDERTSFALPALFLELAELEPGTDKGTGQVSLIGKFEARIVLGAECARHNHQAAHMAAQLAVLLRAQYWGLEDLEPALFVQAVPDWTKPQLDGYTVWLVEWTHELLLGEEEWPWSDQPAQPQRLDLGPDPVEVVVRGP